MFNRKEMSELLKLAWPATFSSLCFALMEVVDTAMLGLIGVGSLAGAALASTVLLLVLALPSNFLRVVAPIAAGTSGTADSAGNIRSLSRLVASVGFVLGAVSALIVCTAALSLTVFGYDPELVASARTYLLWRAPFLPVEIVFLGGWSLLEGLGKTRLTLFVGAATNGVNVIFNLLLIPGPWGLPAFGVAGAAVATDISVVIGLSVISICLYRRAAEQARFGARAVRVVANDSRALSAPDSVASRLLRLGWPLGISGLIEVIGGVVLGLVIARFGQDTTAVHSIISRLIGLGLAGASGIGVATTTLVARAAARRVGDDLDQSVRRSLVAQVGTQTVVALLFVVGLNRCAPWLSSDSSVLGSVFDLTPLWLMILWTEGLITVQTSVLEGLARTRRLLWVTIGDLSLLLPGTVLLVPQHGLRGLYLAWLLKNIVKVVMLLRYREAAGEGTFSPAHLLQPLVPWKQRSTELQSLNSTSVGRGVKQPPQRTRLPDYRVWRVPIPDG
jgi:MATE family, multidrug efflux pump